MVELARRLSFAPEPRQDLLLLAFGELLYLEGLEGDLAVESVDQVLTGEALARARRFAYGIEPAPARFICRNCRYALVRPG